MGRMHVHSSSLAQSSNISHNLVEISFIWIHESLESVPCNLCGLEKQRGSDSSLARHGPVFDVKVTQRGQQR